MSHHQTVGGVGLAYRFCLHQSIMENSSEIDLLEIPTEDYIVRSRRMMVDPHLKLLHEAVSTIPSVAHGIQMSIGSVEPFEPTYFESTARLLEETGIEVFSEHLTFHRMNKVDLESFLPMPFTHDSVSWVVQKYREARFRLARPFALENISYYFPIPDCELSEAEFLNELLSQTDCSLLLDVTNVFNNSFNHQYDPVEFIMSLPGDRVSQIHLAGGRFVDGIWIDDHSSSVMPEVWPLLELALDHTNANIVVLERDDNFDPFDKVLDDICKARKVFDNSCAKRIRNQKAEIGPDRIEKQLDQLNQEENEPAELKAFQQSLLFEITACEQLESESCNKLSPTWLTRLEKCDQTRLEIMRQKWKSVSDRSKVEQLAYQQREWQLWKNVLNKS